MSNSQGLLRSLRGMRNLISVLCVALAVAYSCKNACATDYKKYCGEYGLETAALKSCMDRNGKKLSKTCVNALVRGGQVSQAEVDRRKKGN